MANSHRGSVLPRMPIVPMRASVEVPVFSDEMMAQIRAVWVRDLYELQRSLRPWYVRLWELIRGR
jgi:hypothetical protein